MFTRLLTLFLLIGLSLPLAAEVEPSRFFARYDVEVDGIKFGEMERTLRLTADNRYQLETRLYTTGWVSLFKKDRFLERSVWSLDAGRPRPYSYLYTHTGGDKELVERLDFDWEAMQVTSLRDGKKSTVAAVPGLLDKLVYQFVLRRDLQQGATGELVYQVADRGDIRDYRFRVEGEETLDTPMGPLRTLRVRRLSSDKERKTTIWTAVERDHLLVRIEQEDDGHSFASQLTSYKALP